MRMITAILLVASSAYAAPHALPAPKQGGLYVIAHRGAHEGIPENTVAAYKKGIELNCDFVEVDFRETKDKAIVSVHNDDINAYTKDAKGPVKNFTLAELKALDIGSRVEPQWKDERIPTMEEILNACEGKIGLYVDLKKAPVPVVAKALQDHGLAAISVWYADPDEYRTLASVCPECQPMPDTTGVQDLEKVKKEFEPAAVSPSFSAISKEYVEKCHALGMKLFIDEEGKDYRACWNQMLAWGVDGIQTDHPAELIEFLKARAATGGK